MELRTIKDLIKERDTALSVLRKTEGKETEKRKKARDMFGFYNHQCLAETERIILASRNQACEHFSELANNQQSHSMKLKAIWQALLDKLLSMSDRYSFFG